MNYLWLGLAAVLCQAQDPGALAPGNRLHVESSLKDAAFFVDTEAGEFIRISLEGLDTELSVAGVRIHDVDGALDYGWIAAEKGSSRIEVSREGSFDIVLAERHAASDADRKRARAWGLEAESERVDTSVAANRKPLLATLEQAETLFREAGDPRGEALAASRLSDRILGLGGQAPAYPHVVRASELIGEVATPSWQAGVWRRMGEERAWRGQLAEAIPAFEKALAIERESGNPRGEAYALNAMALAYQDKGDLGRALELLQQALPIRRKLGVPEAIANGLRTLGAVQISMGDDVGGRASLEEALGWWRKTTNKRGESITLHSLSEAYSNAGEHEKAIELEEAARKALVESGGSGDEPAILTGEALSLNALGQPQRAADLLRRSIDVLKNQNQPAGESSTRIILCGSERAMGHLAEAMKQCTAALEAARKAQNPTFEAASLAGIGMLQHLQDNTPEGLKTSAQALEILRKIKYRLGQGRVLTAMGSMAMRTGATAEAIGYLRESRAILSDLRASTLESYSLYWLARAEAQSGDGDAALRDNTAALEITEKFRSKIDQSDLRSSFFVTTQDYYQQQIDLLMRKHQAEPDQGWDAKALETAESARARLLLDSFGEAKTDQPGLAGEERALRAQIVSASARLTKVLGGPHTPAQQEAAEKKVADLVTQQETLKASIRAAGGKYADLVFPQPVSADRLRGALLDSETRLLEFSLGDERSYAWVVSPDAVSSFILPGRNNIEGLERRAYAWWTHTDESISARGVPKQLSRTILEPLWKQLNAKRILIVTDGSLAYVPFAALPEPGSAQPLIVKHEISMLPSASVLMESRNEMASRPRAAKDLAILADPVFDGADPRVGLSGGGIPDPEPRAETFERLRWTRVEADRIAALSPTPPFRALDFDANRAALESPAIANYRILHIASHSILNEKRPELSGIVLSLVDKTGKSTNGYVQAREIYDLRLRADLVVLSACETAMGKEVRGEGIMSLMRAFEYAGSPRVVASIWKVPDAPTAELMQRFYAAMFRKRIPAAAALREAQLAMWQSGRWSDPRDWAGFVIEGEFR